MMTDYLRWWWNCFQIPLDSQVLIQQSVQSVSILIRRYHLLQRLGGWIWQYQTGPHGDALRQIVLKKLSRSSLGALAVLGFLLKANPWTTGAVVGVGTNSSLHYWEVDGGFAEMSSVLSFHRTKQNIVCQRPFWGHNRGDAKRIIWRLHKC